MRPKDAAAHARAAIRLLFAAGFAVTAASRHAIVLARAVGYTFYKNRIL